jgi:phosphatidylserine decarboxylase
MGIAINETEEPEGGFQSFGQFFGRRLKSDARPVCSDESAVVSPCDGQLVAMGEIDSEDDPAFLIKGSHYNIGSLLGNVAEGQNYRSGQYFIIYLHPRDYHRVHVPFDCSLERVRSIPGARYSVASWCERRVDGIYGKNERMVFALELPNGKKAALVMVAAFGVGNIATKYGFDYGQKMAVCKERDFHPKEAITRGQEIGAFLLGSTVAMVIENGALELNRDFTLGSVVMGQKIGTTDIPNESSFDVRQ